MSRQPAVVPQQEIEIQEAPEDWNERGAAWWTQLVNDHKGDPSSIKVLERPDFTDHDGGSDKLVTLEWMHKPHGGKLEALDDPDLPQTLPVQVNEVFSTLRARYTDGRAWDHTDEFKVTARIAGLTGVKVNKTFSITFRLPRIPDARPTPGNGNGANHAGAAALIEELQRAGFLKTPMADAPGQSPAPPPGVGDAPHSFNEEVRRLERQRWEADSRHQRELDEARRAADRREQELLREADNLRGELRAKESELTRERDGHQDAKRRAEDLQRRVDELQREPRKSGFDEWSQNPLVLKFIDNWFTAQKQKPRDIDPIEMTRNLHELMQDLRDPDRQKGNLETILGKGVEVAEKVQDGLRESRSAFFEPILKFADAMGIDLEQWLPMHGQRVLDAYKAIRDNHGERVWFSLLELAKSSDRLPIALNFADRFAQVARHLREPVDRLYQDHALPALLEYFRAYENGELDEEEPEDEEQPQADPEPIVITPPPAQPVRPPAPAIEPQAEAAAEEPEAQPGNPEEAS